MLQKCRQMLKNEKGLTLIELLAVVVILGIIAAIAIPSIGGLIDNSKKDAHVANAQAMISAARLAVTANQDLVNADNETISLEELLDGRYIEPVTDPDDDGGYDEENSFVVVENGQVTEVRLVNNSRGIFNGTGGVDIDSLSRDSVIDITPEPTPGG